MSKRREREILGPPWPELMTIREAAAYLNVAPNTVAAWVYRTRELPHVSLSPSRRSRRKICRIHKPVLDALIAQGERPAFRVVKGTKA